MFRHHAPPQQSAPPRYGDGLLSEVIDSSHDAIVLMNDSGVVERWNPAAEAMYGVPAAEAVGRRTLRTIPPERRDELDHLLSEAAQGRSVPAYETIRLRASGEGFPASVMAFPIFDEEGNRRGCATIERDISQRVKAADALRDALADALRAQPGEVPLPG